jgi:hypothetical protein
MTKTVLYTYFGTNGTITSPIHLPDIYCLKKTRLTADPGKVLTNGTRVDVSVVVTDETIDQWTEVDK